MMSYESIDGTLYKSTSHWGLFPVQMPIRELPEVIRRYRERQDVPRLVDELI